MDYKRCAVCANCHRIRTHERAGWPEPENAKAARYAPPIGVHGGKAHRARNGGL